MLKRMLVVAAALAMFVAPPAVQAARQKDIVDTAVAAGNFKTLAAALQAAGLVDTLKGKGPFTVFAPTDEAFAKIPKAALDALIADKAKLTKVLTYHVVAGKVMAADVVKLKEAKTVKGPFPLRVSMRPAAWRAAARVLKFPAATAVSTMSFWLAAWTADGATNIARAAATTSMRFSISSSP